MIQSVRCQAGFVLEVFFFQAEDGIRDADVTGVQTCALPISIGSSATSSRNNVPPAACSKTPRCLDVAPVKAPRSWPNSSLSASDTVRALQLTARKGLPQRGPLKWMARATNSFPLPLSPVISTGLLELVTRLIFSKTSRMRELLPIS